MKEPIVHSVNEWEEAYKYVEAPFDWECTNGNTITAFRMAYEAIRKYDARKQEIDKIAYDSGKKFKAAITNEIRRRDKAKGRKK